MRKMKFQSRKVIRQNSSYNGEYHSNKVYTQLYVYNEDEINSNIEYDINLFKGFKTDNHNNWLNIHGLNEPDIIKNIGEKVNLHSLTIQDILDVNQRPSFLEYDNYWFFSLKSILPDKKNIQTEQLSFVLGENYLISFQEKKADYFEHVRDRLINKVGKVRERSVDYLLYLLLEAILDNYSKTLLAFDSNIENISFLEDKGKATPELLFKLESFKRDIYQVKKSLIPFRDFLLKTERDEPPFLKKEHIKYYRDLKEFCMSLIEECDQVELRIESNINLFFSAQGHKMNEIMKTLTVVSAIFIPLTFFAGIYGMNFQYIPELAWKWGYFAFWGLILIIFVSLLFYFKKKNWF